MRCFFIAIQISNREIKEFQKYFLNWIIINFPLEKNISETEAGYDSQEQKDTKDWDNLKDKLKELIENCIKNSTLELISNIFNSLVETLIEIKKDTNMMTIPPIENFAEMYISVLKEFTGKSSSKYSSLTSPYQFSPKTFDYICNEFAQDNIELNWIDINYWKDKIYEKIDETKQTSDLLFSLRSMINFIEYKKEKEKRLKDL